MPVIRRPSEPPMAVEAIPFAGGVVVVVTVANPTEARDNQDAAAALGAVGGCGLLVVADGAGGHPLPAAAARLAVGEMARAADRFADSPRTAIVDGFERANRRVRGLGVGAATTLLAVEVCDGKVRPYHAGDSLALVVGGRGRVRLHTVGHGPVAQAVDAGTLDGEAALDHHELNIVTNLVGMADMRIEIGPAISLRPRDTVLLASDGLFDNMVAEEVVDLIRKGPIVDAANALIQETLRRMTSPRPGEPSKPDDLSIILYRPKS